MAEHVIYEATNGYRCKNCGPEVFYRNPNLEEDLPKFRRADDCSEVYGSGRGSGGAGNFSAASSDMFIRSGGWG